MALARSEVYDAELAAELVAKLAPTRGPTVLAWSGLHGGRSGRRTGADQGRHVPGVAGIV